MEVEDHLTPAASTEVTDRATLAPGWAPLSRIVSGVSAAESCGLTESCKSPAAAAGSATAGETSKETATRGSASHFLASLNPITRSGSRPVSTYLARLVVTAAALRSDHQKAPLW
jgi:hypothetical protein